MTNYRFPLLCVLLIALAIGAAPAPHAMAAAEEAEPEAAAAVCVAADLDLDLGDCIRFGSCEVCEVDNMPEGCVVKICPDGEGGETHNVDCGDPD